MPTRLAPVYKKIKDPFIECRAPNAALGAPDGEMLTKTIDLIRPAGSISPGSPMTHEYDADEHILPEFHNKEGSLVDGQFEDWIECAIVDRQWRTDTETMVRRCRLTSV